MTSNFRYAPPPTIVDGLLAVPIDIQQLTANLRFDADTESCDVDATIEFIVGPADGNPIFDLRQTIGAAWLDGSPIGLTLLAHHDFGGGPNAELRVAESVLAAGSTHNLRLTYQLGLPDSPSSSSGPPTYDWSAGRLNLKFWYTDLRPGRYLDAWLPGNLIFDQFSADLDIEIVNTGISHLLITNGARTDLATNRWRATFPAHYTVCTGMLRIHPSDQIVSRMGSVSLPSGRSVEIHTHKFAGSSTDLALQEGRIASMLGANETSAGAYAHGSRFTAFFEGSGGMEYGGATRAAPTALGHEVYHSWWGRGVQPATQNDSWWDEGWTVYVGAGLSPAPRGPGEAPVALYSQNPWSRRTPGSSYGLGSRFFQGLAALIGDSALRLFMRDFYAGRVNGLASTLELESYLLARSGEASLVSDFHRFAYGFDTPDAPPNLWLKDDPTHGGDELWMGRFWDSPDVWVRNAADDRSEHQNPVAGHDNWFYARVRNQGDTARHFMCTFNVKSWLGTEFVYPSDFLPCVAATGGFELAPGETRVVKAMWPAALVPPAGAHGCLLASALAVGDLPTLGRHVWEDNNLAQKNLTIVAVAPGDWVLLPVIVGSRFRKRRSITLELIRPRGFSRMPASILFPAVRPAEVDEQALIDCGGIRPIEDGEPRRSPWSSVDLPAWVVSAFAEAEESKLGGGRVVQTSIRSKAGLPRLLGVRLGLPRNAKRGRSLVVDILQRDGKGRIAGGVAVQLDVGVKTPRSHENPSGSSSFTQEDRYPNPARRS